MKSKNSNKTLLTISLIVNIALGIDLIFFTEALSNKYLICVGVIFILQGILKAIDLFKTF